MNHDELVDHCLGKPGATPDEPWEGDLVAKVGGKIFAFLGNSISFDGAIGDDELIEMVDASYEAVLAKLPKSKRPR